MSCWWGNQNWECPVTGLFYSSCTCGLHRCGYCGRRQRDQNRRDYMCQCHWNRIANRVDPTRRPSYRAWCVSWGDDEEQSGSDLVPYGGSTGPSSPGPRAILVPFYNLGSPSDAAEAYADYIHRERDGWEASWPLTIRVRSPDGSVHDFEVERETVPKFHATEVEVQ